MKNCLITFLTLFLALDLSWAGTTTKKDFLKKFPLKEGHYDTIVDKNTKTDFCENEELDIMLRESDGELVLTIGPKLVFPDLQKTDAVTEVGKNCVVKTTNTVLNSSLKQTVSETCGKKQTYQKTHVLKLDGDVINYEFTASPGHQVEKCKYKFLTLKAGST